MSQHQDTSSIEVLPAASWTPTCTILASSGNDAAIVIAIGPEQATINLDQYRFHEDGDQVFKALYDNLPSGTFDRLTIKILMARLDSLRIGCRNSDIAAEADRLAAVINDIFGRRERD